MTDPIRFQLQRRAGWRMPEGGISVARPHRWGNTYRVGQPLVVRRGGRRFGTAEEMGPVEVVEFFRRDLTAGALSFTVDDVRRELAGHPLGCFCPIGSPCHGDLLIHVAAGADPATYLVPPLP